LAFDVGEPRAGFGLFKDQDSSPSSLAWYGCDMIIYDAIVKSNDLCPDDPPMFNYLST